MNPQVPCRQQKPWIIWSLVAMGLALFVGANAHLAYVAFASQPDCVSHSKSSGEAHDYRAAKSAC